MKKFISVMMCVFVLVSLVGCGQRFDEVNATVYEINTVENLVAFEDTNGDIWVAEVEDASTYELGEVLILVFDDCGTADLYDDEIVDILG